jgi:hypothetical protein
VGVGTEEDRRSEGGRLVRRNGAHNSHWARLSPIGNSGEVHHPHPGLSAGQLSYAYCSPHIPYMSVLGIVFPLCL